MDKVRIVEVGPRDGLQNEKVILSTEDKLTFIELLSQTGLKDIEATSFVRADAIPQMYDSSDLFRLLSKKSFFHSLNFPCLVPNITGLQSALKVGVKEIAIFSATSETFNKKNINATIEEAHDRLTEVAQEAHKNKLKVRGYVSTAFGCPYEGKISTKQLSQAIKRLLDLGVYEVSIGDTTGIATPLQVKTVLKDLIQDFGATKLALHFHDTRGMALTNIYVSLENGIRTFDSSCGGLGGCPYASGATGNVATEDVWYLCESMGLETEISIDKLIDASTWILNKIGKLTTSKFILSYQKNK